jgi:hypothetical protein
VVFSPSKGAYEVAACAALEFRKTGDKTAATNNTTDPATIEFMNWRKSARELPGGQLHAPPSNQSDQTPSQYQFGEDGRNEEVGKTVAFKILSERRCSAGTGCGVFILRHVEENARKGE